ncbi:EcKinase 1 [Frankliniella occidentalis]|uniref:Uncharacterized protein LOC113203904 n=1 Tax=Frankliniella occidentalis TaxID=133901 RepID=A0A6J1S1X6_FRAOC|nr:uncharacterized protein LOC113203904 [Frankliniella occidentalis]KAE8744749.1 EcKinase 1 [Frankliniella occidentalis]
MASDTMVQLQQQGALEGVTEQAQLEELDLAFYQGTLRKAEGDGDLRLHGLDVRPGCKVGDNFSSIVTRNTARGVRGNGTGFQRSVIVKRAPDRDRFRCLAAFAKETEAYSVLVPALARAVSWSRLPLPRCLHASETERPDHIVLEDLAAEGFAMPPRGRELDQAHAALVLRALGRFHGASLALRYADPATFHRLRADTAELIFFPEAEAVFSSTLGAAASLAVLSLKRSGRADLGRRLTARAAAPGIFREMCDAVLPPTDDGEVPAVFTHGDCWANNLLFRYKDGHPCETKLIDLAGIRCSSPALDLLHFLYTSVSREVRTVHRQQLLDEYLDSLRETLQETAGTNPAVDQHTTSTIVATGIPLTRAQLEVEMRRRAPFGLWMGLWMLPAIFFSPSLLPKGPGPVDYYSQATQAHLCAALPKEFHQRVLHLVEEHAEIGALENESREA